MVSEKWVVSITSPKTYYYCFFFNNEIEINVPKNLFSAGDHNTFCLYQQRITYFSRILQRILFHRSLNFFFILLLSTFSCFHNSDLGTFCTTFPIKKKILRIGKRHKMRRIISHLACGISICTFSEDDAAILLEDIFSELRMYIQIPCRK